MKIVVIGCGYVGLTTALGFALRGHEVTAVETNQEKLNQLLSGELPFYEPSLNSAMANVSNLHIKFTDESSSSIHQADIVFLCVGTPLEKRYLQNAISNKLDVSSVTDLCHHALNIFKGYSSQKRLVVKSTMNPGDTRRMIKGIPNNVQVIFNPEFLQEGSALKNFNNPDRILIGTTDGQPDPIMDELYRDFGCEVMHMSYESAELAKLTANTMLASRVTLINEVARIVENFSQADILDIQKAVGADPRIGKEYLRAGIGWGGSCLPKDVQAINSLTFNKQTTDAIEISNTVNIEYWAQTISDVMDDHDDDETVIAVWGLTFKPNTCDLRESPAIKFIDEFSNSHLSGLKFQIYDPSGVRPDLGVLEKYCQIEYCNNIQDTTVDASGILLLTEWQEFIDYDPSALLLTMKHRRIFDGRNALDPKKYVDLGFNYFGVGRHIDPLL